MPEYKKKKRSRFGDKPKKRENNPPQREDIKMSRGEKGNKKSGLKVVKGKKPNYKKRAVILAAIAASVLIFIFIFRFFYPAGVIEGIKNGMALIGSGEYPIELIGSRTVDVKARDSYYFVLTNKQVKAFSNSGKQLFSHTHGYESPVIKISQSRALVFDQGGKELCIFTLEGLVSSIETKNAILTAAISDSGVYSYATESENYASAVSVFSKADERLYEWFSAEDIVNNVAIDHKGEKIAVSTFNANSGKIVASVKILGFESPKALYTKTFTDGIVYMLDSSYRGSLAMVSENELCVVDWFGEEEKSYNSDYSASLFRATDNYVAVFNRENDKTDNKIVVLSDEGEKEAQVSFSGIISDIAVRGEHIYCISDSKVYVINFKGKIIRETKCSFGSVRAVISDGSTALIISDSKIEKLELERE